MTQRSTGTYVQDPRVDRAISWALMAFAAVSLAVGAYFFRDLSGSVKGLNAAVSNLRTEVAVMRVDRERIGELKMDLRELTARVRALEATPR